MSVPNRRDSAALLLSLKPPAWHLRHSRVVAETAAWLAWQAVSAGRSLDRRLVESASLLHDIDKLGSVKPEVDELPHGEGSADWLARRGHAELGPVIVGHPTMQLIDAAWFERWLETAPPEGLILAYADKRAGQRLESMAQRFGSWERRYPPEERTGRTRGSWTSETLGAVWRRAETIELRVCELAGVTPDEVRRLAWTGRALRSARAG